MERTLTWGGVWDACLCSLLSFCPACCLLLQVPGIADTILRRIGAPHVPDLRTSGWAGTPHLQQQLAALSSSLSSASAETTTGGGGAGDSRAVAVAAAAVAAEFLFRPLHERADISQLRVEQGGPPLFPKLLLVAPATTPPPEPTTVVVA